MNEPELSALVDQAARNLESLELLARASSELDYLKVLELRERLRELHLAYIRETDAITQHVLTLAMERRTSGGDRRGTDRREGGRRVPPRAMGEPGPSSTAGEV